MKKLIILLLSIFLLVGLSDARMMQSTVTGQSVAAAVVNDCDNSLICQQLENASGYDNSETWSETIQTGTINEDYTVTKLSGDYSLYIEESTGDVTRTEFTGSGSGFAADNEVWGVIKMRWITLSSSSNDAYTIAIRSGGGSPSTAAFISIHLDGKISLDHGSDNDTTGSIVVSTATNYYLWWYYLADPGGSTGKLHVWFDTVAEGKTRPVSTTLELNAGTSAGTATAIYIGGRDDAEYIADLIIVKGTEFTEVSDP